MRITLPEPGRLGAAIEDLDLRDPGSCPVAEILALVHKHKLLVFRGQQLDNEQYLRAARLFGRPQVYFQAHYHHPDHPEIFVSSNIPENGRKVGVAGTGRFWHSDYQFFDEPLSLTFVYPKVLPRTRRETLFIDMENVWRRLPADLRREAEGARFFHEATWYYKVQPWDIDRALIDLVKEFRQISPGAEHPAVITHPVTGAESLYMSEGFTTAVAGRTHEENQSLLPRFFEFIGRAEHVHAQVWHEGDLLFWDNRGLIHRSGAVPSGEPSKSYRIGVYDGLPFYAPGPPARSGSARALAEAAGS